jgi:putrescine transport system permease protein
MEQMLGWPKGRGVITMWIGHVMLCVSYVAIIVQSRVKELNRSLEEAALDLGATPFKVFFLITLPLISQALMSGWLLSFTLSIDDLVLSAFLSGPGSTTLPLVVFSRVRLGLNPEMNALATLFITAVTIGVIVVNQWMLMRERRRTRDMQLAFAIATEADAPAALPRAATATARKALDPANA